MYTWIHKSRRYWNAEFAEFTKRYLNICLKKYSLISICADFLRRNTFKTSELLKNATEIENSIEKLGDVTFVQVRIFINEFNKQKSPYVFSK